MVIEDINEKVLQVGDIIAYPCQSGLSFAKVLSIRPSKYNNDIARVKISCYKEVKDHSNLFGRFVKAGVYKRASSRYNLMHHNSYMYYTLRPGQFIITDIAPNVVKDDLKANKALIREYVNNKK